MIKNKKNRASSEGRAELETLRSIDKSPMSAASDEELEAYAAGASPKSHTLAGGFQGNKGGRRYSGGGLVKGMGAATRGGKYKVC